MINCNEIKNIVASFLKNGEAFKLIHQSPTRPLLSPMTRRLLVLDSSFNPPHLGHLSMIKESILKLKDDGTSLANVASINTNSVLLLFGVRNADKGTVSVEEYSNRLAMVEMMSEYIMSELGVSCGIALTSASLFVDKSDLVNEWVQRHSQNDVNKYFLLGFDTIIRFFDPKYYKGSLSDSLDPFFANSKICVFLRKDPSSRLDVSSQVKYLETLEIPQDWKHKITFCQSQREWSISSSGIRRTISTDNSDSSWHDKVIPSIRDYIIENQIYKGT